MRSLQAENRSVSKSPEYKPKSRLPKARVESLAEQIKTLRGRMASYEQQILQTPQVERGLITLMRDHESAQKKYEEIRAKQMNAKINENLEGENKAERFTLLEPPALPDKPARPDRIKTIAVWTLRRPSEARADLFSCSKRSTSVFAGKRRLP
jgi:succinoglycan biosynthesis transport protein ExoP